MMMSATWKKTFSPIQTPEKGILGQKLDFLSERLKMGVFLLKKFPVVIIEYVLRKVRIGTIPEFSCAKWEFSLCRAK